MKTKIFVSLAATAFLGSACKNEQSQQEVAGTGTDIEETDLGVNGQLDQGEPNEVVLEQPGLTQRLAIEKEEGAIRAESAIGIADIQSLDGSELSGQVIFYQDDNGPLKAEVKVSGLAAGATHAIHIHENGDCSDGGQAAGGHFNPTNDPHGRPDEEASHVGDLGNLTAEKDGMVQTVIIKDRPDDAGFAGWESILNRAVIIHENADEFTQPAGDAGMRIGCGVITAFEQE